MSVEVHFQLPESFIETATGSQTKKFAEKILSLPQHYFPLTPKQTAKLLWFDDEKIGAESIQRWIKAGILKPDNPQALTKEEIIVLKLVQMNFATATTSLSFLEAHQLLSQQLQGSELERLVGSLEITKSHVRGSARLLEPYVDDKGDWWVDTTSPFIDRRALGLKNR